MVMVISIARNSWSSPFFRGNVGNRKIIKSTMSFYGCRELRMIFFCGPCRILQLIQYTVGFSCQNHRSSRPAFSIRALSSWTAEKIRADFIETPLVNNLHQQKRCVWLFLGQTSVGWYPCIIILKSIEYGMFMDVQPYIFPFWWVMVSLFGNVYLLQIIVYRQIIWLLISMCSVNIDVWQKNWMRNFFEQSNSCLLSSGLKFQASWGATFQTTVGVPWDSACAHGSAEQLPKRHPDSCWFTNHLMHSIVMGCHGV